MLKWKYILIATESKSFGKFYCLSRGVSKVTIRSRFSRTVPIFDDVSLKKSQFSQDAHLSLFWLGALGLSWRWQTALFHCTHTNAYLLEPESERLNSSLNSLLSTGALLRTLLGELTMLPQLDLWRLVNVALAPYTTHAFGTRPRLRWPNYGHRVSSIKVHHYRSTYRILCFLVEIA